MRTCRIALIIISIAVLYGCTQRFEKKQDFRDEQLKLIIDSASNYQYFNNVNKILDSDFLFGKHGKSHRRWFGYDVKNYKLFTLGFALSDEYRCLKSPDVKLIIIDTLSKQIELVQTPCFDKYTYLHSTQDYYYFPVEFYGSQYVWADSVIDWVNGIIVFPRKTFPEHTYFSFKNKLPVLVEQQGEYLRVVISHQEATTDPISYLSSYISDHYFKYYYVDTGIYEEILIDDSGKQVSRKKIDEDEIYRE